MHAIERGRAGVERAVRKKTCGVHCAPRVLHNDSPVRRSEPADADPRRRAAEAATLSGAVA